MGVGRVNLSKLARLLGKAAVYTRDVNAVKRGRVGKRVTNRVMGRGASKIMRKLWR